MTKRQRRYEKFKTSTWLLRDPRSLRKNPGKLAQMAISIAKDYDVVMWFNISTEELEKILAARRHNEFLLDSVGIALTRDDARLLAKRLMQFLEATK